MSAISGIFYRNERSVDPKLIKLMNDKLYHRGPDGSKIWCEGSVALGHQMLHTTPESLHETLPFEKDGIIITADARIDNRKELSEKLNIEDEESVPDSYFILIAYRKWGEKCPEKLLGDFAFAIWDKDNEKLFCARDHMGIKPFYYYMTNNAFFFATEMKALLAIPEIPYKLNELELAFYLTRSNTDKNFTFYKNILFLNDAHTITINQNNHKKRKYWEIDPKSKIIMNSKEEYIKSFFDIFTEAIRCRLRSAFPIGFELSGGLDSSSVVCMAKKILNENKDYPININTYSMIFDELPQVDESYYIKKVVKDNEINPHFIPSDNISPLKEIEKIFKCQEQPFYTSNMTILRNMYKNMQENNIRILLGGNGGDEIVSHGINYLLDLASDMHWIKLIKELNGFSKRTNSSVPNLFLKLIIIPLIPIPVKNFIRKFTLTSDEKSNEYENFILNKEFAKKLGGKDYFNGLNFKSIISKIKKARKIHYFIITSHDCTLEMQDRNLSSFLIEPRYPYFDKRLVEFCYAIPDEMKFKNGWNRYILRVSMENILPKEIQWRPLKKYFGSVLEKNFLLFEKNILDEIFCSNNPKIENYVNLDMLKLIYEKYNSGNENKNLEQLWSATLLHLWLQYSNII